MSAFLPNPFSARAGLSSRLVAQTSLPVSWHCKITGRDACATNDLKKPKRGTRRLCALRRLFPVLLAVVCLTTGLHAQSSDNYENGRVPIQPDLRLEAKPAPSSGTSLMPFRFNLGIDAAKEPRDIDMGIKILFAITLLTLAPSIILLMTCFTRIVVVLSFVRTALSLQGAPSNQIIIGLALFMTFFIMAPVWDGINHDALQPYMNKQLSGDLALDKASGHIRGFMLKQARAKDVELFAAMAKIGPTTPDQLPLRVVIPGFIISELRTAFQMGFLLFVPFILIDLVVATVLMSMGMMMMPPATIALPLKLLLFVLVDGWSLVVRSLIQSFGV